MNVIVVILIRIEGLVKEINNLCLVLIKHYQIFAYLLKCSIQIFADLVVCFLGTESL